MLLRDSKIRLGEDFFNEGHFQSPGADPIHEHRPHRRCRSCLRWARPATSGHHGADLPDLHAIRAPQRHTPGLPKPSSIAFFESVAVHPAMMANNEPHRPGFSQATVCVSCHYGKIEAAPGPELNTISTAPWRLESSCHRSPTIAPCIRPSPRLVRIAPYPGVKIALTAIVGPVLGPSPPLQLQ